MARIRTIKPEFWLDEDLSELSCETHMFAAALLNHCDDEGYFKANPKLLHAQIFALRELDGSVTDFVKSLEGAGYLSCFTGADGKLYGQVINFNKHQSINKATASKIKGLKQITQQSGSCPVVLPSGKERKGTGNREQGKEQGTGKGNTNIAQFPNHSKMFDDFYAEYPNKKDRKRAKVVFEKFKPDEQLFEKIMSGLKNQIAWRSSHPPGQFLPEWKHPSTWLNGENWQDELEEPSLKQVNGRNNRQSVSDHNAQAAGEWLASQQPVIEVNQNER